MARAREVPGFDCEEPFARAAARVVEVRAAEVFEHAGVLDSGEIERLHDCDVMLPRAWEIESLRDLLRTRRELLHHRFRELWHEHEERGTWTFL